jgi:hypothetical protein
MILLKTLVTLKYLPLFLQLSRHKKIRPSACRQGRIL